MAVRAFPRTSHAISANSPRGNPAFCIAGDLRNFSLATEHRAMRVLLGVDPSLQTLSGHAVL